MGSDESEFKSRLCHHMWRFGWSVSSSLSWEAMAPTFLGYWKDWPIRCMHSTLHRAWYTGSSDVIFVRVHCTLDTQKQWHWPLFIFETLFHFFIGCFWPEIWANRGINFLSRWCGLWKWNLIKKYTAYHPECHGLVGRFTANLKGAVRTSGDKHRNN